ncbi:DMT family transporter [Candidatus Peribacteria bacterium]|nr:DMT family transporter [Candidatus Peribacteria bacterium]
MFLRSSEHNRHIALTSLLLAVVFSNSQPVFSKLLYAQGWTPVSLYFLALLVVTVFLGIHEFLEWAEQGRWDMARSDIRGTLLTTVTGGVMSPILYFTGLELVQASDAVLIASFTPVFTVLFAVMMLGERFNKATIIGGSFLIAGLGVLIWTDVWNATFTIGSMYLLGASITSALTTILHKKYVTHRHIDSIVFVRTSLSLLIIGLWVAIAEPQSFGLFIAPQNVLLVFGFPLIGVLLPFFFFFGALRTLKAMDVGLVSGIGPIAGMLLAATFLKEQIAPVQVISLICIILGILNINVPLTKWRIVPSRLVGMGPLRK